MQVVEATDDLEAQWEAFVTAAPMGSFLQSWAWGEFQRVAGFPVTRLAVRNSPDGELQCVCLVTERALPLRRHSLYAPWGPVLGGALEDPSAAGAVVALTADLRTRLRARRGVFARMEPKCSPLPRAVAALRAAGWTVTGKGVQPKDTLVLDLTRGEDDLLRQMHPKTRYNIRLARRHGVVVEEATTRGSLQHFLAFARDLERKGTFRYHPARYYEAMFDVLSPRGMLTILLARHQSTPLAVHLLLRYGATVTYAHGASSRQRASVMAPYLLQWESMLRAKASGASRYDLFGLAPKSAGAGHPWLGMSRFKHGFGGTEEHYLGAADLLLEPTLYRAYELGRSLRTLLR